MKAWTRLRLCVVAGLLAVCLRSQAQGFRLSASASASVITGSNPLTYALTLTNQTGVLLTNVVVTNIFSAGVTLVSATNSQGSNNVVSSGLVFRLGALTNGNSAQMSVTIQTTAAGFITNTITAAAIGTTNIASTNLAVQFITAQADLGVTLTKPTQAVVTNDLAEYSVTVTNLGPSAAPNVMLTNMLPPGVILKGASQSYSVSSNNLLFSLGTLASGGFTKIQIVIQPTNVTSLLLSASVGAPGLLDPNSTNNAASANIAVIGYLAGTLIAVTNSPQILNLENGLTEQSILLSNAGPSDIPAARVVVSGLGKQLFNAVGTNNENPFVYLSAPLTAGKSVNLLLQYNPRGSFPFSNNQLRAYAVPLPDWRLSGALTNKSVQVLRTATSAIGNTIIEFASTAGKSYTIVYSDDVSFSNAKIAPPSIVAPANFVHWIDYGPPTTSNAPAGSGSRFYYIFENP